MGSTASHCVSQVAEALMGRGPSRSRSGARQRKSQDEDAPPVQKRSRTTSVVDVGNSALPAGSLVTVVGLQSAAGQSLNGRTGRVEGVAPDGRLAVRVSGTIKSLKPENLRVSTAPENPLDSGDYFARVSTQDELDRVTVPLAEAAARLPEVMREYGIAVVTGVIPTQQELLELEEDFKRDLDDLVDKEALAEAPESVRAAYQRFVQGGPRHFPVRTVSERMTQSAGFCLDQCLAHGRFGWRVRRHPNIHAAFAALFPGAGPLVTSLDATFFTPAGQRPAFKSDFCAHVDQNKHDHRPSLGDCDVYQGVLYVWPSDMEGRSSTTVVWPGSHRLVWPRMMEDASFKEMGEGGFHYCEIASMSDRETARELADGWSRHALRMAVPAGALLLWNSRTVHTGWKGGPRLAQAVCLEPAGVRPEAERISKLRLAALGLPGCHWARATMQHDMSLGAPGFFSDEAVEAEDGRGDPDRAILPLRPALRPLALAEGADLRRLEELVTVDYRFCGMWQPPKDAAKLLEASVKEEFKPFL